MEPEPQAATAVFGDRIGLVRVYAENLAERGEELGLIGPLELPRLWTRHIINCGLVAPLVEAGARVGDIGSGAGLPGIVLAIARPDAHFVLIEPMERRVDWLREQVEVLGLENTTVLRARAEEAVFSPWLDQVTARAVTALRTLVPMASRLVRSGGQLLFLKGASVEAEMGAAEKAMRKARLSAIEVLELGSEFGTETTRVFRATVD